MLDLRATVRWVTGIITGPDATARSYQETAPSWQHTFFVLTLPLYVVAYLIAVILSSVTGGDLLFGSLSFGVAVFAFLWSLLWTFVIAVLFDWLSEKCGGKRKFDAAYAVVGLAIVPAAVGTAIGPFPWIGWLISLAASIYSLMLAYRFLPLFLEIPEDNRAKHFALSIIAALVVNIIVSMAMGPLFFGSAVNDVMRDSGSEDAAVGVFGGGFERQAQVVEAASEDTFDPPVDGKLTDAQVARFADALAKTQALKDRLGGSLKDMEEKEPSFSDLMNGVSGAVRLSTAEMEVVKTAGGNWAEHQWVRGQIETARIQQDLNDTTAHNYAIFLKYRDSIERYE
jgi:hypothetical protein